MSERQTAYAAIVEDFDYENDAAMQELGWQVSNQIAAVMTEPEGLDTLQRAADLLALASLPKEYVVILARYKGKQEILIDVTGDLAQIFTGDNAIAAAAAFVRGERGV